MVKLLQNCEKIYTSCTLNSWYKVVLMEETKMRVSPILHLMSLFTVALYIICVDTQKVEKLHSLLKK